MHLDDEQTQRFLHRELAPAAEAAVRGHLAACADCRRRVAEAEWEEHQVYALLRRLDHPRPRADADAVTARACARAGGWGRAAGVLLALGAAGAAYAAPGSPLPAWVGAVVARLEGRPGPSPSAATPARAGGPGAAGIAVVPGRELAIVFTSPHAAGRARVSLTDGAEVVVRALTGTATFTSDVDQLVVDTRGAPATFEIRIPRAAPRVEIRVEGDRIFLKEGPRVTARRSTDAQGAYLLPLIPSGS